MMRRTVSLLILALTTSAIAMFAQAAEPLVGVWNVDIFKSVYVTGQPPVRRAITVEAVGDNLRVTQETTNQGYCLLKTSVRAYSTPASVVPFVAIVSVRFRFDSFMTAVSVCMPLIFPMRS